MHEEKQDKPRFPPAVWFIAYVLAACPVLYIAALPLETLLRHVLYEDCYYYLKVAQNILDGSGVTFDGSAPTNGFHPLWMAVCAAGIFVAGSASAPAALIWVAAGLHLLQGLLVFRILKRLVDIRIAHAACIFYLVNYRIIACNLCGLETPLAVFAVLSMARELLANAGRPLNTGRAIRLGALYAFATLSRFDLLLLAIPVAHIVFIGNGQTRSLWKRISRATIVFSTSLLLVLPYFIWSCHHSQSLLPNSGRATSAWSGPSISIALSLSENASILRRQIFGGLWWLTDTANLYGLLPVALPENRKLGVLLLLILLPVSWAVLRPPKVAAREPIRALAGYSLIHFTFYFVFKRPEVRYLMMFCALTFLVLPILAQQLMRQGPKKRLPLVCSFAVFGA